MKADVVITLVKSLLRKTIEKNAKQLNCDVSKIDIMIKASDNEGNPSISIHNDGYFVKNIKTSDLYSKFDPIAMIPGVNLSSLIDEYLKKFILRVSNEKGISILTPSFGIMIQNETLYAIMYIDGKPLKFSDTRLDIPIDYILETK